MKDKLTIADRFINPSIKPNTIEYRQAKMLVNISLLTSFFTFLYLVISLLVGFEKGVYVMLFDIVGFLTVAYLVKRNVNLNFLSNLYIAIGAAAIYYLIVYTGGLYSPIMLWLVAAPILALLVANRGSAITWSLIMLMGILFFSFLEVYGIRPESEIPDGINLIASISIIIGLMMIIFLITLIFEKEKTEAFNDANAKNQQLSKIINELTNTKNRLEKSHDEIQKKNDQLLHQQKEIVKQTHLLKELNGEKDYIIEVLAHDMKEPINSIDGLLDLIMKDTNKLSQNQLECVDHIQKTVTKSRNLLTKILLTGEKEHHNPKINLESIDICVMIQNSIDAFQKRALNKHIAIEKSSNKAEIFIQTDTLLVSQIFENIISNSLKFSPKNSTVSISIEKLDSNVKIEFKDQGPGIAKHEVDMLFNKYTKLSNKPTGGESSTGLGLSLVKRYVDMLDGKIWYESNLDKGANFILILPLRN